MPEWHIHVKNEMSSYNANVSRYRGDTDRDRPSSEQLVDLHVYIVPPDIWRDRYNNLPNQSVVETISVGIIRVHPESKVYILRDEIEQQVGIDLIPRDYVFLKSVGRSLTRLKPKQEYQVKVKHFLPPHAYAPELYILEATPDIRAGLVASSSENSTRPQTRTSINQADDSPRNSYSYRDSYQYGKNRESVEDLHQGKNRHPPHVSDRPRSVSPLTRRRHSPLPPIIQNSPTSGQKTPSRSAARSPPSSPTPLDRHRQNLTSGLGVVSQTPVNVSDGRHLPHTGQNNVDPHFSKWEHPQQKSLSQDPPHAQLSKNSPQSQIFQQNSSTPSRYQNGFHEKSPQPIDRQLPQEHLSPFHHDPAILSRNSPKGAQPDYTNDDNRPPLSSSPTHSAEKVISSQRDKQGPDPKGLYDPRATYVTTTNEDSGIAGLTPDDHYREHYEDVLDRRKQEEDRRKRDADLQRQLDQDRARKEQEAAERHQRRREEYERANWEQCKKDEEKRKREERRRDQDNDKRYGDEKDKEKDRNVRKSGSQTDDELNRFPSPPQFRNASADKEDTESSKEIRSSKEKLLLELEAAKESRRKIEKEREELIKRVKQQQNKTHNRRNHARDLWKKKYFEEKKKTNPLEEQSNRFRNELEIIHRKLMSTLEGPREKGTKLIDLKPSRKSNYKISAAKLIHELEDLKRRMDNSKMKLTAEMKLRNQAETELRALRAELTQKKINLTLTRTQQLATLMPAPDLLMTTR